MIQQLSLELCSATAFPEMIFSVLILGCGRGRRGEKTGALDLEMGESERRLLCARPRSGASAVYVLAVAPCQPTTLAVVAALITPDCYSEAPVRALLPPHGRPPRGTGARPSSPPIGASSLSERCSQGSPSVVAVGTRGCGGRARARLVQGNIHQRKKSIYISIACSMYI